MSGGDAVHPDGHPRDFGDLVSPARSGGPFDALHDVAFPGFTFELGNDGLHPWLRVRCRGRCNATGADMSWTGRKWRLSAHMTKGEVVQTAFLAVMTAIEHETRERFTYRGVSIFDPHYDIDRLVALRCDPTAIAKRAA